MRPFNVPFWLCLRYYYVLMYASGMFLFLNRAVFCYINEILML
jgi:hypothetical protein